MAGLLLANCADVQINNHYFCGSLGAGGAACSWFMPDDQHQPYNMTLQEFAAWWDDLSDPKVATELSTILDWKADIEQLCTDVNACSDATVMQVDNLINKIQSAETAAKKVTAPVNPQHN